MNKGKKNALVNMFKESSEKIEPQPKTEVVHHHYAGSIYIEHLSVKCLDDLIKGCAKQGK